MRKISIAVIIATCLMLGGCGNVEHTNLASSAMTNISDWVDKDTGAHYLIYSGYYKGGITPRYNSDGTLMIDEVSEE